MPLIERPTKCGSRQYSSMRRLPAIDYTCSWRLTTEVVSCVDTICLATTKGMPVLLFDDLVINANVDFKFDRDINSRWRVVGEVVSRFSDLAPTMPDAQFVSWARLRRLAPMPEDGVTIQVLDEVYDDLVGLCMTIDVKDRDRARLLASANWWNDAPVTIDMGSHGASAPR